MFIDCVFFFLKLLIEEYLSLWGLCSCIIYFIVYDSRKKKKKLIWFVSMEIVKC